MSALSILAALTMFMLTHVVAGMIPIAFTGEAQMAVLLVSIMVAIASYVSVEQAMAGVRV